MRKTQGAHLQDGPIKVRGARHSRRARARARPVRLRRRRRADAASSGGPDKAEIRVWLNGTDTPQEARDWLKTTFEDQHPGSTLTIEQQEWEGLVEKLTTSLSSDSETPDVVEVGNTQAPTFTSAGAFSDVSDDLEGWGGDDLLPGFVEAAQVDGKTFAVPYYAGSKYIFYRKDLFEQAGISVPTTMDEFVQAAIDLKKANPQPANFSGFWFPGQDWRNGVAFVWDAGGDLAVEDGDEWKGALSTPESVAGLETVQTLMEQASGAAKDGNEENPQTPFCAGEVGMLSAPGWVKGLIEDPDTGLPRHGRRPGRLRAARQRRRARPGAARRLRHRDLGHVEEPGPGPRRRSALMLSDDYQKMHGRCRAHPRQAARWPASSVTTSSPRRPSRPRPTPS